MMRSTCAVLLAAGGGSRFLGSSHKLEALIPDTGTGTGVTGNGQAVWRRSLDHMVATGLTNLAVVDGAVRLDATIADTHPHVRVIHNPDWRDGQTSSLRCAVRFATDHHCEALVIGLADQPGIPTEAWLRVIEAPARWPIVCATYGGVRGPNPVRLLRQVWTLLPDEGDVGARNVIRTHPDLVWDVACPGSPADIDTVEDLRRWTP
jgi:CTP:molybdopterin cytidylyltransferase MocA